MNSVHKLQPLTIWLFTFRFEICKTMAVLSTVYLLLALFEIKVLIGFAIFFASIAAFFYFKWRVVREKGLINYASPKTKQVLLRRSFSDLFKDQVYFPYFTKILGLFIKAAVTKPHPQQLDKMFENLPEKVKNAIYTKGILHLAPSKVEQLVLQKKPDVLAQLEIIPYDKKQEILSKSYGTVNPIWDRRIEYQTSDVKIHEHTISKELVWRIGEKLKWGHIIMLACILAVAMRKTKGAKLQKILLYNGSVFGFFALIALVFIKYKEPLRQYKEKIEKIGK